ncbi:MAG: hypothetical protein IBX69_16280 [Anaerolineales bacterium]|nr:hypothetical protein [Anaerolineales bacterium]
MIKSHWLKYVFIAAYFLVGFGFLMTMFSHWAYDDPFITYRYAHNLADGMGFVYNPNEHVLSTTTPLFTIVLASLNWLWLDLPSIANLIGVVSLLVAAIFLWDLSGSMKAPMVGWAGLLLYPTFPLLVMTLGSETPLYLAFSLGAFAFYARENYRMTAALTALAVLTRPDGILVAFVLGVDYLIRLFGFQSLQENNNSRMYLRINTQLFGQFGVTLQRIVRTIPWYAVVLFIGLTLPWFIYAWTNFGSPIPATMSAKQLQGSMAISEKFAPGLLSIAGQYAAHWQYWLQLILSIVGVIYLIMRAHRWLILIAWMVLYFIGYTILGVSRYFWYYAPLLPGFLVLVGLGIEAITGTARFFMSKRSWYRWLIPLSIGIVLVLFSAQIVHLYQLKAVPDGRYPIYREVGEWLQAHTEPGSLVGTLEVGIIGYYSQREMIDFAGLIYPQVAAQLSPHTNYEDAALYVQETFKPDYMVLHEGLFQRLEQTLIEKRCNLARYFVGERHGFASNLSIYVCNY